MIKDIISRLTCCPDFIWTTVWLLRSSVTPEDVCKGCETNLSTYQPSYIHIMCQTDEARQHHWIKYFFIRISSSLCREWNFSPKVQLSYCSYFFLPHLSTTNITGFVFRRSNKSINTQKLLCLNLKNIFVDKYFFQGLFSCTKFVTFCKH